MARKRKNWNGLMSGFKESDLVFLDESGCNTDMTRRYAYSLGGSRAVDATPLSKPKNTTILSSIQLDGTFHYTTFSGGTTVEHFKQYLKEELLPHLNCDSVLVMDNMKSHHAKAVKDLLDSSGVRYIYASEHNVFKRDARGYRCQIYRGMLDAIFAILFRNDPKDIEILQTW